MKLGIREIDSNDYKMESNIGTSFSGKEPLLARLLWQHRQKNCLNHSIKVLCGPVPFHKIVHTEVSKTKERIGVGFSVNHVDSEAVIQPHLLDGMQRVVCEGIGIAKR